MSTDFAANIDVAVIGGGAAGLMAGIAAARAGARTVVYERMVRPGRKVAIAGGGRCNFTNTLNAREFVRRFGGRNARHLGHALRAFPRDGLLALLAAHGVETQVERGYHLFVKNGRGEDVVKALVAELAAAGGVLESPARILALTRGDDSFVLAGTFAGVDGVRTARAVVICTGGMSYPATGSTGDGYDLARQCGHTVTELRAGLVGLTVDEPWPLTLQGLVWQDTQLSLFDSSLQPPASRLKPLATERGELLFTHFGISGPPVLDISNVFVTSGTPRARLHVDFFPALSRQELDDRLRMRLSRFPNRGVAGVLDGFHGLPARLAQQIADALGPDSDAPANQLSKTARTHLIALLKETPLTVTGTRGIEHGEVTVGGVAWEQIDPATLESRLLPRLFFAGEILDVAGRCGGFNLQAAFSTGVLSGRSAAAKTTSQGKGGEN